MESSNLISGRVHPTHPHSITYSIGSTSASFPDTSPVPTQHGCQSSSALSDHALSAANIPSERPAKMILDSCALHSTCNSPLVHSAAHLPMETMAKLPPLNGTSFPTSLNVSSQGISQLEPSQKWTLFKQPQIAIAVYNFWPNRAATNTIKFKSSCSSSWAAHSLEFSLGDVIICVEHYGEKWYRGYLEGSTQLGIFPSSYVQQFDQTSSDSPEGSYFTSFYYTLLDPLFLQVVRSLREWQRHILAFYRSNVNIEKYQAIQKLMRELIEICEGSFGKELAPSLWRRRCNQLLKESNDTTLTDPFVKLYLDEDENPRAESDTSRSVIEPSLEELYDRVLSKLNQGNQLLNLEIMPSFTHGVFSSDNTLTYSTLVRKNRLQSYQYWSGGRGESHRKFQPFVSRENSKYLTSILEYYTGLNRKLGNQRKSQVASHLGRAPSLSFHSPLHGQVIHQLTGSNSCHGSNTSKKYRRHLLLSIREANFSSLFSQLAESEQQSPLLQIDVHILRCNNSITSSGDCAYQVLTEKYCYRVRASGQPLLTHSKCQSWGNANRALFLDVLSKKNSAPLNDTNNVSSQHSDSANCYLVIQVWRYGKMLINESRTKNMLSATMSSASASLSSGTSVFHTISSNSLSSGTAPSTTSLSSLTSFVSNSTLFGTEKSTASSTPDSSSIDSSEFGNAGSFKRSVGFAIVPLLELVSRDQELKANSDLLRDESVISRVLLADEGMLSSVAIRLFEGDMTSSALESVLKHRQQCNSIATNTLAFSSTSNSIASSAASISKLSQLTGNYQLIVCAKFISELIISTSANSPSSNISIGSGNVRNAFERRSSQVTSLADWLLLSQCSTSTLTNSSKEHSGTAKSLHFIVVQKRSFGEFITAGYFRNDFYLTLEGAEFEKGGKAIPKNIEVSICLLTETGIQERALSSGANDEPVTFYRSHIQYHQNSPKWQENLKVNVPLEHFESAHLRFTFSHCSSKERERKFVGFSFLPLAEKNGACLADGEHELYIYKCDSEKKLDDIAYYLNVPCGSQEKAPFSSGHSSSSFIASSTASASSTSLINSRSSKEVLHLRTQLVSSKLTQNSDILLLLKWSCTPVEQVFDALTRIGRNGEEMVKFLEDILDALFTLFTNFSGSLESKPQIIFRVLVDFFKTLNDPKFAPYRIALETYIENQFSAPLVHSAVLKSVQKYIEFVIISFQANASGSPPSVGGETKRELEFILRCLSVFDWILKIIVQSRILYTQASANGMLLDGESLEVQSCEDFRAEIFSLFQSINRLLSVETKSSDDYLIIAIQESVLGTLPNAFSYLSKITSALELSKLVRSIVSSNINAEWSPLSSQTTTPTNQTSNGKKTIISAKLLLLQETIRCTHVWSNEEARLELLDTFIRLLNVHINDSKNSLAILYDITLYLLENSPANCKVKIASSFDAKLSHACNREIEMLSFGAIDVIVEHIIELTGVVTSGSSFDLLSCTSPSKRSQATRTDDDQDTLSAYILCFMILLDFMSMSNYEKLFETRSTRQCKELLIHIFMVFLNVIYYFNDSWLEIKMAVNRIILQSLSSLRRIMSQEFLGTEKFDLTLWRTYFKLSIAFLTQQRLQFDSSQMPYWKRRFILDTYGGDMRMMMGEELISSWNALGSSKIVFIPSLVAAFVDVTLVPQFELRTKTLPIFYDMLSVDYDTNGNFKQVESALIEKLDSLSQKSECDIQYRELFNKILSQLIEKKKPVWYFDGQSLVKSVSRLLSLLIDYRHELKYKLNSARQSANELDESLLICTYTLLRFYRDEIDTYNRKSIMLRYVDKLANLHVLLGNYTEAAFALKLHADQLTWSPAESSRKESLHENMLEKFEKGHCWEEGLKVCKDLQDIYEHNYKFAKLSSILKRNAQLLDKILTHHRPMCEYYRVSFFGLDFPSFLQNSTFIFRGREFEKISDFTHRIQQEFPNAQLLTKNIPSDQSITESYSQYIQIFSVKPIAEPPVSSDQSLIFGPPDNVLGYYQSNFVCQFIQDRPIQRPPFFPTNQFKSLWIERTMYTTEKPLPGIVRMFQVVSTQLTYLSPIENACETIENMNNELSKLISTYSNEQTRSESISPLSMRLQGILEAAVNGGIAKYLDAFLGAEFLSSNPDQVSHVTLLKNRIANQIKIVESGMALHGRLAPTPVRPLHTRLLERFGTMRNIVNQANIEISQALLWTPSQPAQASTPSRPSILSQPLPPIPKILSRPDALNDPDTSSASSSSSTNPTNHNETSLPLKATPPLQPPPLPPSYSFLNQSPNTKSLKKKPLPPLPQDDTCLSNVNHNVTITSQAHQRHHSTSFEHSNSLSSQSPSGHLPMDDSIYSVPLLPDSNTVEQGSSVDDDSLDYYDDEGSPPVSASGHSRTIPRSVYRSRSIPRTSISHYNGKDMISHEAPLLPPLQRGQSNQNLHELEDDSAPPPLPPRSIANLDRSNSLNSHVRSSPLNPPLIPPALPSRRVRKSSSTSNSSYPSSGATVISNTTVFSSHSKGQFSDPDSSYLENLDGIEFENLVISSPTPRTESSHQSNRPAPIIGIEIGNDIENTLFPTTPLITDSISTFVDPIKIQAHRSKSNSLPRMQQFAMNFESISSTSTASITKTSTVMEHFENKIVSSMATTAVLVATNGASNSHAYKTSHADTNCKTNSSLLD